MAGSSSTPPDANIELKSKFMLEMDGIAVMAFEKCKLGNLEWGKLDHRTGNEGLTLHSSSGLQKTTTIELSKFLREGGIGDIKSFYAAYEQGSKNKFSGAVILLDRDDAEIGRATWREGFVSAIGEVDFDSSDDSNPVEWNVTITVPTYILE